MPTKLKQAAASRKSMTGSIYIALIGTILTTLSSIWPAMRGEIPTVYWAAGTVAIAALVTALHHWQGRA